MQVEYIKEPNYKIDSDSTLSQHQIYNEFEQHISPLDPNMSSVARYSPIYSSENSNTPYGNPIVVTHLIPNNDSNLMTPLELNGTSPDLGQVVSTRFLQMVDDNVIPSTTAGAEVPPVVANTEQEVDSILITDQNTGEYYNLFFYNGIGNLLWQVNEE